MSRYYRVQADIDLDAIRKNIETMRSRIPEGKQLLAVIKANAYGHGAVAVAEALDDLADYFGVACIDEAVELRNAGVEKPILILGMTDESLFEDVVEFDITQTIFTLEQAKAMAETAGRLGKTGKLHIKLDTGMNRIGFPCTEESAEEIAAIFRLPNLNVEGIFTHYFKADVKDKTSAEGQLAAFAGMLARLEERGITFALRHISNSAGIMEMPNDTYDMVRSGISTYGLYPSEEMNKEACVLYPAMELKSHVTHIKTVRAGETVGYGGTYTLKEDRRIATVGAGYADGYPRALSNRGRMLVNGQFAPVVGRVCMDQTMIDVSDIPGVKTGDEVVLAGRQGDLVISVEELSGMSASFNYEFVCGVNRRVPRIYWQNGKRQGELNYLRQDRQRFTPPDE
ncbi:MAG: alanine racemase [Bacteroidales bacterium]|nr:alanine racemase [Clostridium sp.]MCM1203900.1 alanine racemase [Bacteroidales bacterium]